MRSIKKRVYPSTNQNESGGGGAGNPNESTPLHTISKNTQATIEIASPTLSTATQNLNHEDSTLQVGTKTQPSKFWLIFGMRI